MIAFIDAQERVQRINSQFTAIFGYVPEEVIGRSMDDTVIPESRQAEAKSVKADIRQGLHLFHETVRRRKDGTLVEVSITSATSAWRTVGRHHCRARTGR